MPNMAYFIFKNQGMKVLCRRTSSSQPAAFGSVFLTNHEEALLSYKPTGYVKLDPLALIK
jgi:hypothetical protein